MKTAEKILALALVLIILFLGYVMYYAVQKSLARQKAPRPTPTAAPQSSQSAPTAAVAPERAPSPAQSVPKKGVEKKKKTRSQMPGSIKELNTVLKKNPKDSASLFSRGMLKASLGDCSGAETDFSKAVSLDQSYKDKVPSHLDACKQK